MIAANWRWLRVFGIGMMMLFGLSLMEHLKAHETEVAPSSAVRQTSEAEQGSDPMPASDEYTGKVPDVGATAQMSAPESGPMFDTDRGVPLVDTDGDGFPDLTESLELTNPFDATNYPGSDMPAEKADEGEVADPGFPATSCRSGYRQAGSRLCISTNVHNARSYANAMVYCRDRRGRVASYGDLRYLYVRTSLDAAYNPSGRWIGNFVDDDRALCGNRSITTNNDPDIGNFEGECSRFDNRNFWCAHDRQ